MPRMGGVTVQSVIRALDILECFNGQIKELGISELSEQMSLSKSTIYGLVNTLLVKGYLEQDEISKRYRLGIKLFEMGYLVNERMDLRREAKSFCEELAKKYNATVHIAARFGNEIVYVDKVDMPDAFVVFSQVGKSAPMYCTGVGKAILASLDDIQISHYINNCKFSKFTDNTITNIEDLREELKKIRANGYAVDNEEVVPGLRCVSASIFNHSNLPIAAISVSKTSGTINSDQVKSISVDVMNSASQISRRLGYNK